MACSLSIGREASNDQPYEWLTAQFAASAKRDLNFFVDVGELEDHATLGGSGPNFRDATRRFRDVLKAKGYSLAYTEVPGGQHAPQYWPPQYLSGVRPGVPQCPARARRIHRPAHPRPAGEP